MYRTAHAHDEKVIFYLDSAGNKYVASGGSLAWRLNNPGLVHRSGWFSRDHDSIGHFDHYAIFSNPEKGRAALAKWLHTKKYFKGSLKTLAKHYQPNDSDSFANQLASLTNIPVRTKIKDLNKQEFEQLLVCIEKLCGYTSKGDEKISILPKIIGRIEKGKNLEDTYLIGGGIVLSKKEALEWAQSNRLDAVIVHEYGGELHLRSRPNHCIQNIHLPTAIFSREDIDPLVRIVGTAKPGQCIWAFINGIDNTKREALESAERISAMTGNEQVLSMPNDTRCKLADLGDCLVLKTSANIPIINWAVKFLRYLLTLEQKENAPVPIVIFAHSQGAIILEHALELLKPSETELFRIFTFGGGSFIASGKSHPDSHNYASAVDFVCRLASPNLQLLALRRYYACKEGLSDLQMIEQLSFQDATLYIDSIDAKVLKSYVEQRIRHYENELSRISNLTILDPDPGSRWKHKFSSDCYQLTVQKIIQKYRKKSE